MTDTTPDPADKLPIEHALQPDLPWRAADRTDCGRPVSDVAAVISRAEMAAKFRRLGKQRAAYTTCMTCLNNIGRWPATWADDPVAVMARMFHGWRNGDDRLRDELRALGALVEAHRDEFEGFMAGLGETVSLADRRRQARRAAR